MTRIVLHIGLPKTGSSALQYGFDLHRDALRRYGVHYAIGRHAVQDLPGGISSGNGAPLVVYLDPSRRMPKFDRDAFERSFDRTYLSEDYPVSLLSSENLAFARPDLLSAFLDRIVGKRDLTVVAFVRDLYPQARAAWVQSVKRGLNTQPFGKWVGPHSYSAQFALIEKYESIVGQERVKLLHYDSVKGDLVGAFFKALDVNVDGLDRTLPWINRSLSDAEIAVLRKCNGLHHDRKLGRILSDGLIAANPGRASTQAFDATIFESFVQNCSATLNAMNAKYFAGEPVWKVGERRDQGSGGTLIVTEPVVTIWAEVVSVLIDTLKKSEK